MTYESWRISYQSSEAAARSAWQEMIRLHHRVNELEAQLSAIGAGGVEPLRKQAVRRAPAAPVPQWVRPVSELLGHISDVLPNSAFNKIDTAKWNAVSALVGATTQAAAQGMDARDAARYRWLRDNDWRNDEKMEPVIRLHLNAIWDEKIDAAMAAQARNKKGIEQ